MGLGGKLITVAIGVLFIAVGVGVPFLAQQSIDEQKQVREKSEPVNATIQNIDASQRTEMRTETTTVRRGGERRTRTEEVEVTIYSANITFDYSVDDEPYTSSNVESEALGGGPKEFEDESERESFLQNYSEGQTIQAYYVPEKPGEAFILKPDPDESMFIFPVIIGAVFGGVGVLVVLLGTGIISRGQVQ